MIHPLKLKLKINGSEEKDKEKENGDKTISEINDNEVEINAPDTPDNEEENNTN